MPASTPSCGGRPAWRTRGPVAEGGRQLLGIIRHPHLCQQLRQLRREAAHLHGLHPCPLARLCTEAPRGAERRREWRQRRVGGGGSGTRRPVKGGHASVHAPAVASPVKNQSSRPGGAEPAAGSVGATRGWLPDSRDPPGALRRACLARRGRPPLAGWAAGGCLGALSAAHCILRAAGADFAQHDSLPRWAPGLHNCWASGRAAPPLRPPPTSMPSRFGAGKPCMRHVSVLPSARRSAGSTHALPGLARLPPSADACGSDRRHNKGNCIAPTLQCVTAGTIHVHDVAQQLPNTPGVVLRGRPCLQARPVAGSV